MALINISGNREHFDIQSLYFSIGEKIAKKIGDREVTIEIEIADHFSNCDRDRNRDLNFGDRAHALLSEDQ